MRHSKTEKANTHKRIVTIAAKKFREEGLAGVGIADLMKEAGITADGFYKHFKSRDALVAEAIDSALERNRSSWAICPDTTMCRSPFKTPTIPDGREWAEIGRLSPSLGSYSAI